MALRGAALQRAARFFVFEPAPRFRPGPAAQCSQRHKGTARLRAHPGTAPKEGERPHGHGPRAVPGSRRHKIEASWHNLCVQDLGAGRFSCIQRSAPELDAPLLFIVGWVGGDSGRHSPGRLLPTAGQRRVLERLHQLPIANLLKPWPRSGVFRPPVTCHLSTINHQPATRQKPINQRKGAKKACQAAPAGVYSTQGMRK